MVPELCAARRVVARPKGDAEMYIGIGLGGIIILILILWLLGVI